MTNFTGRFAPSPSGELHIGNLRTALAAWLDARAQNAAFLVRIDDLDPDRSRAAYVDAQLAALRTLGLDWDGDPVRQTARRARYEQALAQLDSEDATYPCFCSRADVRAAAGAPHGETSDSVYPGTCARLATSEARARVAAGAPHSIRARTGGESVTIIDDLSGALTTTLDDFVVRRRDGVPAYNLASPLDEADLAIGRVVRGDDLLDNTSRQAWIARRLGVDEPRYAHIPLVTTAHGQRLAKRDGAVTLAQLQHEGTTVAQVRAWMAQSLGIASEHATAARTAADLVPHFSLSRIPRTAATWP